MSSIFELKHHSGARAEVNLFGATLTSFYTAAEPQRNVLFVSKQAALDGTKPIRGGVPLVFPVFGSAAGFPNHGFARTSTEWKVAAVEQTVGDAESPAVAKFTMGANDATRAMRPHEFELVYEVRLFADRLITALHVDNKSSTDISFQALLHTYLSIPDVRNEGCLVQGLQGVEYTDKLTNAVKKEDREAIGFAAETDSVYANAPSVVTVVTKCPNSGVPRMTTVEKASFLNHDPKNHAQPSDVVVWNPWINKSKGMSDFGDEEYINMVCIEPGRVSTPQQLAPGKTYTLQQTITTSKL
ncbi:TPA: hypothetical protein N0F65_002440 [Lagenidium giganteum]|uniref:glucose-6-phosphate 1-epimerase n=1 Tax=Lagenidium giganteum TaxID=4803 RepID=A0AAV2YPQ5_9STRA|nr:TPA: hypothetical protein N0F65_002440 [Lagenidium giganteum]